MVGNQPRRALRDSPGSWLCSPVWGSASHCDSSPPATLLPRARLPFQEALSVCLSVFLQGPVTQEPSPSWPTEIQTPGSESFHLGPRPRHPKSHRAAQG